MSERRAVSPLKALARFWSGYSFIVVFIVILVGYKVVNPSLTMAGVMNILRHSAVIGIMALGMGLVIITGQIDLSIGSMLAFVGGLTIIVFNMTNSVIVAAIAAVAIGALCGLLNGVLVGKAKMPAFIVTLATMLIFRSVVRYICYTVPVDISGGSNSLFKLLSSNSEWKAFFNFGNSKLIGLPLLIAVLACVEILLVCAFYRSRSSAKLAGGRVKIIYSVIQAIVIIAVIVFWKPILAFFSSKTIGILPMTGVFLIALTLLIVYITTSTKFGKQLYAVGSNERAARLSGINVDNTRIAVFVITGCLTGISAFLWIAMNASVDPATTGGSNEMYAIAAVVLGGISMAGGRGKCVGILFGVLSYTIIDKIIVAMKMNTLIQDGVKGAILIIVIIIQTMSPVIKEYFAAKKARRAIKS
ncbi:MAG: ABC transporter permease [Clostridia bacterium]|nr:ABC transporter permease [Clostridia bacterium]